MTDPVPPVDPKAQALLYLQELPRLIERMHRRFLDVVRLELGKQGIRDISPVQVMMLGNIGSDEISVRDLIERGYYLGSNASYNLKQLVECGYVERQAAVRDRRSARLKLSAKGLETLKKLADREHLWAEPILQQADACGAVETTHGLLRRLERRWSDAVRYADGGEKAADLDF